MHTTESTTPALNRAGRRSLARTGSALGGVGVLVAGSAAALLTAFAGSASAASTITVDSNADGVAVAGNCSDNTPDNCTLRDAAALAVDGDTITFDSSITNITLTNGTINTQAVSITGPGAAALTITTTAAPSPYPYDMFYVTGTGDVTISGLTITKNRVFAKNTGTFTLDSVTISGSTSDGYGGALYVGSVGDLEIINSIFENNTSSQSSGGAVYIINNHDASISGSTFTNNHANISGGALYGVWVNNVTMTNCTVTGNSASERGGGIELRPAFDGAVITITDTTIDANHSDTKGGGLDVQNFDRINDITVNISNTTVSNNTAMYTGGLNFNTDNITATINNSTITANSSVDGAGGIYINPNSSLTINQSTITANDDWNYGGGGIMIGDDTSVVTLSGTVVSGNTGMSDYRWADIALPYSGPPSASFTATNSLIGEVDSRITANGTNNVTSTDPMLGALADNGGATKTMALLTGSPAIDAGPNPVATFTGNQFDQRGTGYARVVGGIVDIGAFEVQPPPAPTTTAPTTTAPTTTAPTTTAPTTTTTAGTDEPLVPAFTG